MATIQSFGFTVTELGSIPFLGGPISTQNTANGPIAVSTPNYFSSRCTINATGKSQVFQYRGTGQSGYQFDYQGAANNMAVDYGRQYAVNP
jgi:hypothetical protein